MSLRLSAGRASSVCSGLTHRSGAEEHTEPRQRGPVTVGATERPGLDALRRGQCPLASPKSSYSHGAVGAEPDVRRSRSRRQRPAAAAAEGAGIPRLIGRASSTGSGPVGMRSASVATRHKFRGRGRARHVLFEAADRRDVGAIQRREQLASRVERISGRH